MLFAAALVFTSCSNGSDSGGGGTPTPKHAVNFSVDGANGTIKATVDGTEISSGAEVEQGKTVVFTATPDAGFHVKGWTLDGTAVNGTNNSYSFPVTKAAEVKVSFENTPLPQYAVNFSVEGANGTLKAKADGVAETDVSPINVEKGKTVTFTAFPAAGYEVEKWTVNGTAVPGNTSTTYEHTVTQATDIRVSFVSSVTIPDNFTLSNGAEYEVVDKAQKQVLMTKYESDSISGIYTVAITVEYSGITYTLTGFSTECIGKFGNLSSLEAFALSGETAFLSVDGGVLFDKAKTKLICYPNGKTGTSYRVPDGITVLGNGSFYGNSTLTAIVLPTSLTTIEDWALYACFKLKTVNIPSTLTSIGNAFLGYSKVEDVKIPEGITKLDYLFLCNCTKLKTVELPASLTAVDSSFCGSCTKLQSLTCKAVTPPALGQYAFENVTLSGVELKVPAAAVSAYEGTAIWKDFKKPFVALP